MTCTRKGWTCCGPYRVLVTGSHPEYESLQMMDALDGWMRQGGRLMYLGGNGFYWRIAYHPTRPGTIEVRRSEDGTRAWDAEVGEYYHSFTGEYGGLWRRNNRAPQALAGVGFISQGFDHSSYYRRTEASHDPRAAFIFDGVPEEILGDFGILQGGAAGLEIDCVDPVLGTPPHALVVARSENHSNTYELVNEEVRVAHGLTDGVINQQIHADMVFFETQSGGAVFSTGSIAYAGSFGHRDFDNPIARLTLERAATVCRSDAVRAAAGVRQGSKYPSIQETSPSPCGRGLGGGGAHRPWPLPPTPSRKGRGRGRFPMSYAPSPTSLCPMLYLQRPDFLCPMLDLQCPYGLSVPRAQLRKILLPKLPDLALTLLRPHLLLSGATPRDGSCRISSSADR